MGRRLPSRLFLAVLSTIVLVRGQAPPASTPGARAETLNGWTPAEVISSDEDSWFPDIAEDASGRVHVIWTSRNGLNYRAWSDEVWSAETDLTAIVGASHESHGNVVRAAIAPDRKGLLHLFGTMLNNGTGNYTHANAVRAVQASAWSRFKKIGESGAGYYSALQVDSLDRLHAVYTGRPQGSPLADTYYRLSTDGGVTWSAPVNLSGSPEAGSTRPQVLIDGRRRVHVSWDEGWDRLTGKGKIQTSRYRWSRDGSHWSDAHTFGTPDLPSAQLVVAAAGAPGGRLAVWRSSGDNHIYCQQSQDDGETWSPPSSIPGIRARSWNSPPFDQYALATDANGVVHLVIVGLADGSRSQTWRVMHVAWSHGKWEAPETIFERDGFYPEYPRVSVGHGGLHAVWFTRKVLFQETPRVVWHSARPDVESAVGDQASPPARGRPAAATASRSFGATAATRW